MNFSPGHSQQYLQATLIVSLLSVWVLVGLFFYLNRYTKRDYFNIWTAGWLFYALWLTLGITELNGQTAGWNFIIRQWCVCFSAVFLLWGSLRFVGIPVRQASFGLFMLFLVVWNIVSPQMISNQVQAQTPVFILIGGGSVFAGVCFFRVRKKMPYVGAGMLSLGFFLWGVYLFSYPFTEQKGLEDLYDAGYLIAAIVQLFIAVSMIVLVLEEVRYNSQKIEAEISKVRSEKEELQAKILTTEARCSSLYEQVRLTQGTQTAYEELRQTQQVVVEQERLRALGQMASGIAHDVNNALCPIVGYCQLLLQKETNLGNSSLNHLRAIERAARDISHTVARLREFYRRRPESDHLVKAQINQIVNEVVEMTRPRWRDQAQRDGIKIEVQLELGSDLPMLLSDPSDLREALTNLMFNAVDALPEGGVIVLATRCLNDSPSGTRKLQVEVRDNGVGMDEQTRQRCLEPFFSTKSNRGGSGLGLAMVYGMTHRHDGTIEIDSAPGKGTSMCLTFPITDTNVEAPSPAAAPDVDPNRTLRVLCIDDEPQVLEMLKDSLSMFGHTVTCATSGNEGIAVFRSTVRAGESFQAIITDRGMPGVDGRQVVRTIKTESPTIPIVMLTGWGEMMKEDGEDVARVDALISKPPDIKELNSLLLKIAQKSNAAPDSTRHDNGLTNSLRKRGATCRVASGSGNGDKGTVPAHNVWTFFTL